MGQALLILESKKVGDWQENTVRLNGEWKGAPIPSYPEALQVYEARISKRSTNHLSRENDEYSAIICGDDFRALSFSVLDENRMLILLRMGKPKEDSNWNRTINTLILIDKKARGFYLVKGMHTTTAIDANQTTTGQQFYGFSKNKLTRYQLQD